MNNAQIFLLILVGLIVIVFIIGLFFVNINLDYRLKNLYKEFYNEEENEKK